MIIEVSDNSRKVIPMIPLTCPVKSNRRKVSMAYVEIRSDSEGHHKVPALFDTGSYPFSYISSSLVDELGLSKQIVNQETKHKTASKDGSFSSEGKVKLTLRFPNSKTIDYWFIVADISTELIIGFDLMERLGAIINLFSKRITLMKLDKVRLDLIATDDWGSVSRITSTDFLDSDFIPLPDDYKKAFPGKNLREIARHLESIPPEKDLSMEQGRKIIDNLLSNEYKRITIPLQTPSEAIKPIPIEFKKGYEDVIVNVPPRSRPSLEWDQIETSVKSWYEAGKVEKSNSPFNAPHVVAPKATKPFYRIAQDYRRLNRVIKPMKFPLRKLEELTEELSAKRYKSTIDQDQAYTQVPISKPDRPKTAFSTRSGKFHFVCFPYGLVISGDAYCQTKSNVLNHGEGYLLMWIYIWTNVDDDAVGTDTVVCHIFILVCIFDRFLIFGMTIRMRKCNWLQYEVRYGGYIVGHGWIKPDPKKAEAIQVIKTPETRKDLSSFLGMA